VYYRVLEYSANFCQPDGQQSRQARAAKPYLPKSKTDRDQNAAIARAEERLRAAGLKI